MTLSLLSSCRWQWLALMAVATSLNVGHVCAAESSEPAEPVRTPAPSLRPLPVASHADNVDIVTGGMVLSASQESTDAQHATGQHAGMCTWLKTDDEAAS